MLRQFILIILVLSCFQLSAQDANNLALDATVKDMEGGRLTGADIVVIQDGALVDKMKTGKNGRFDVLLDFDHEYIIEVRKSGYVTKRMYVNTRNVPQDEQLWGYEYGGFAIDLFKDIQGVDFDILEKPVAKIYYDPNIQNFDYDKVYTKQIKQQLDDLIEDYKKKEKMQEQLLKQLNEDYEVAMKDAENAYEDEDYLTAKENYLAAAALKPDEKEPKEKVAEIERKLKAETNKEQQYMSLLASADQLFGSEKYEDARQKYQEASKIKPNESYPKERIAESNKRFKELKAKQEAEAALAAKDRQYRDEIAKADEEFQAGNYQNAKTYYQNAIGYKPDEDYPRNQLTAIENKLNEASALAQAEAEAKATEERYKAQIAKADAAFNSGSLENALKGYEEALAIKADEQYPKDQIASINEAIAEQTAAAEASAARAKLEAEYKRLMALGDKQLAAGDYDVAEDKYREALALKPGDERATNQLDEIAKRRANEQAALASKQRQAEINAQYTAAISKADQLMRDKSYQEAIVAYEAALGLKTEEQYPATQIALAEKLQVALNQQQAYDAKIAEADAAFNEANYDAAKQSYKEALEVDASADYPKQQLVVIENKLNALALNAEKAAEMEAKKQAFDEVMQLADAAFENEDYATAIGKYEEAADILPAESRPIQQIRLARDRQRQAEELAAQQADAAKVLAAYQAKVALAEEQVAAEEWEKAKETFRLAANIKPDETYPQTQIDKIDAQLKALADEEAEARRKAQLAAEQAEKKAQYDQLMKSAQAYMDSEDYRRAKPQYEAATKLMPDEQAPKDQLEAIDQLLSALAAKEEEEEANRLAYNQAIKEGDQAVIEKNWEKAREAFRLALSIYPDETIPQSRLEEIDALEERYENEQIELAFNALIKSADKLFLEQKYAEAKDAYQEALNIKPENAHALVRLEKIAQKLKTDVDESGDGELVVRRMEEDNYTEGNAKITIRKVYVGENVSIYKRVIHSWGGKYYFLDDQPISELVWNRDSSK